MFSGFILCCYAREENEEDGGKRAARVCITGQFGASVLPDTRHAQRLGHLCLLSALLIGRDFPSDYTTE